jgi:hypothetical protein
MAAPETVAALQQMLAQTMGDKTAAARAALGSIAQSTPLADVSRANPLLPRPSSSPVGGGGGPVPGVRGDRASIAAMVREMAAARGWTGAEAEALHRLIMKESGYNNTAQNPRSTAYGIFQFLDRTWGGYGVPKTSDPRAQTEAGLRYIAARYGSPSRALQFHQSRGWY